ncbi:putative parvalbumin beta-like [Scophthalmus maximus]|uniref:Putative parvalbumin beta-like n=1 Tax=Scophthalmus maximus TaxID=52904 RepID=A0A2U9CPQ2_SCOMX|nr:putative parvalbumin beta-like [Scophthalmus maximus]
MKASKSSPLLDLDKMEDDLRPQVKEAAAAGASLTEQDHVRQFTTSERREEAVKKAFALLEWNEIKYEPDKKHPLSPAAPLSDEQAEAMIQAADAHGDGRIDYRGKKGLFFLLLLMHWPAVTTEEFSDMVKRTEEKEPRK